MGNQLETLSRIAFLKTFLFIINIFFWLSGLLLVVVGIWAEFDLYKYMELSPEFSGSAPHVLLGIAGLMVIVSSVSFSCIIKGQPVLLYVYGGFLASNFIMQIGAAFAVSLNCRTFAKGLHDGLLHSVQTADPLKNNFDFAQANLECCGVANYTDWMRLSPQRVIPTSCCVDPKSCVTANYSDVYQRGCYDVIVEYIQNNSELIVICGALMAAVPTLGAIFSCYLAYMIKKSKYDVMN